MTQWEPQPIAVPLVGGLDIKTRARLVEPTKLLVAENAFFPKTGGPEKRPGNTAERVEEVLIPLVGSEDDEDVYGYGRTRDASVYTGTLYDMSDNPVVGDLRGIAKRDSEKVVWDGWRLFRKTNSGFSKTLYNKTSSTGGASAATAFIPSARTQTIGKTQNSQAYSDCADNGVIRVLAFRDLVAGNVKIKVYDSQSGAMKYEGSSSIANDPEYLRVVAIGEWCHVFVSDIAANEIYVDSFHNDHDYFVSVGNTIATSAGAHFDISVLGNIFLLVYITSTNDVKATYFDSDGTVNTTYAPANTSLVATSNVMAVAVDISPNTDEVGIAWRTSVPEQFARVFTRGLTALNAAVGFATDANCSKITISGSAVTNASGVAVWHIYNDNTLATNRFIRHTTIASDSAGSTALGLRYNVNLVGRSFRVGNVPFFMACFPSDFQTTYLLMDYKMDMCGKFEYGTAANNTADPWMFSFNQGATQYQWHAAIMYKQRVLEQDGVFHEISTKFLELDFLPKFQAAQAGRCLYIPGAQLWCYDGEHLTEAGFHFTIEDPTLTPSNGAGALTNVGEYFYRIYQCHKNAQGEEVRGPALLTAKVTMGAADDTVTIVGKTLPTLREGSYFLVYRNANAGTVWNLVSERDPSSANCPKNSFSAATWTFVDTVSDVDAATRELDPANADGFLHSFSAPACELVAFGKNRLWLSGGELPAGTILPSKLFGTSEAPGFHLNLAYTIDRGADPFTAVGFLSDYLVAFKRKLGYIVTGEPANNVSQNETLQNQKVISDVGSVGPVLAELTAGLVFESEGGIRLVNPAGQVRNIGGDVDPLVTGINSAVVDTTNSLVKLYQDDNCLVFDYETGQWSTWSIGTLSAVEDSIVVGPYVWTASDGYTDAGANYTYRIKSANIGPVLGAFNRIRRVGGLGEADKNYRIWIRTYLDENPAFSEEWAYDSSTENNTSTWGSGTWGSGFWGDSSPSTNQQFARDSVWRWRHRTEKQKCSCISVEIEYTGPDKGPVHTALLFEIGTLKGIDRMGK